MALVEVTNYKFFKVCVECMLKLRVVRIRDRKRAMDAIMQEVQLEVEPIELGPSKEDNQARWNEREKKVVAIACSRGYDVSWMETLGYDQDEHCQVHTEAETLWQSQMEIGAKIVHETDENGNVNDKAFFAEENWVKIASKVIEMRGIFDKADRQVGKVSKKLKGQERLEAEVARNNAVLQLALKQGMKVDWQHAMGFGVGWDELEWAKEAWL